MLSNFLQSSSRLFLAAGRNLSFLFVVDFFLQASKPTPQSVQILDVSLLTTTGVGEAAIAFAFTLNKNANTFSSFDKLFLKVRRQLL